MTWVTRVNWPKCLNFKANLVNLTNLMSWMNLAYLMNWPVELGKLGEIVDLNDFGHLGESYESGEYWPDL